MRIIQLVMLALLVSAPAQAASVFVFDASTFDILTGDSYDDVVAIDTAHVNFQGGDVLADLTLLDAAKATISGGSLVGPLEVFNDGAAVLQILPGTATVDGNPAPDGTILGALDCPNCSLAATLANGDAFAANAVIAQSGTVTITPVPEPGTLAMVGLGLIGLAVGGRRTA